MRFLLLNRIDFLYFQIPARGTWPPFVFIIGGEKSVNHFYAIQFLYNLRGKYPFEWIFSILDDQRENMVPPEIKVKFENIFECYWNPRYIKYKKDTNSDDKYNEIWDLLSISTKEDFADWLLGWMESDPRRCTTGARIIFDKDDLTLFNFINDFRDMNSYRQAMRRFDCEYLERTFY